MLLGEVRSRQLFLATLATYVGVVQQVTISMTFVLIAWSTKSAH